MDTKKYKKSWQIALGNDDEERVQLKKAHPDQYRMLYESFETDTYLVLRCLHYPDMPGMELVYQKGADFILINEVDMKSNGDEKLVQQVIPFSKIDIDTIDLTEPGSGRNAIGHLLFGTNMRGFTGVQIDFKKGTPALIANKIYALLSEANEEMDEEKIQAQANTIDDLWAVAPATTQTPPNREESSVVKRSEPSEAPSSTHKKPRPSAPVQKPRPSPSKTSACGGKEVLDEQSVIPQLSKIMLRVYAYMFVGVMITAVVGFFTSLNADLVYALFLSDSEWLFLSLFGAFGVLYLVGYFIVRKIPYIVGLLIFLAMCFVNGLIFSVVFLVYSPLLVLVAFLITSSIFGIMTVIGLFTKADVTSLGYYLKVALVGIVLAGILNIFILNDFFSFLISVGTLIVFMGLTIYDTYNIKQWIIEDPRVCQSKKIAIQGAISLYLNFIIMLLEILKLLGKIGEEMKK